MSCDLAEPDPVKLSNIDDKAPRLFVDVAVFVFLPALSGVERGETASLIGLANGDRCSSPECERFELNDGLKSTDLASAAHSDCLSS